MLINSKLQLVQLAGLMQYFYASLESLSQANSKLRSFMQAWKISRMDRVGLIQTISIHQIAAFSSPP